nr:hypothetical protein [uncultured Arthrobacter sp.]
MGRITFRVPATKGDRAAFASFLQRFSDTTSEVQFDPAGLLQAPGEQTADQRLASGPARRREKCLKVRRQVLVLRQRRFIDERLRLGQGCPVEPGDPAGERIDLGLDRRIADDPVDLAVSGGVRGIDVICSEEDLERPAAPDEVSEPRHGAAPRHGADTHFEMAKNRVFRRKPHVGRQDELAAGSAGASADDGDGCHGEPAETDEIVEVRVKASRSRRHVRHPGLVAEEIPMRHEEIRVVAAEDDHPKFGIPLGGGEQKGELIDRIRVEEVDRTVGEGARQ